ncbi:MAG: VanZ family protein [Myxococcota bacterium]|jgi:VanZ family protein
MPESQIPRDPRAAAFGLFLWSVALLLGTLQPVYGVSEPFFPFADKFLHAFGWFILGIPAGVMGHTREGRIRAWIACVAFGLLTECGQILVPGRQFELLDLVADAVGAAIGVAVLSTERAIID